MDTIELDGDSDSEEPRTWIPLSEECKAMMPVEVAADRDHWSAKMLDLLLAN